VATQTIYNEFEREVSILASIAHPNIIKFYGACIHPPRIGILMEYCEHGDLLHFFCGGDGARSEKEHPLEERLRILLEIAQAQQFLHSKKIIHRDLKLENVLVSQTLSALLMDFGLSKLLAHTKQQMTVGIGTSIYMAPEITLGLPYDASVDIFAFGIVAFILLEFNFAPYAEDPDDLFSTPENIQFLVAQDSHFRPKWSKMTQVHLVELISKCWENDGCDRPTFKEIIGVLRGGEMDSEPKRTLSAVQTSNVNVSKLGQSHLVEEVKGVKRRLRKLLISAEEDESMQKEIEQHLNTLMSVELSCIQILGDLRDWNALLSREEEHRNASMDSET